MTTAVFVEQRWGVGGTQYVVSARIAAPDRSTTSRELGLKTALAQLHALSDEEVAEGDRLPSAATLAAARDALTSLPDDVPFPEVESDLQGGVSLDWFRSPEQRLVLMVAEDGRYYYAGLRGTRRRKGAGTFQGIVDDDVVREIRHVLA